MGPPPRAVLALAAAVLAPAALPATASADHVRVAASVSARVAELSERSAAVEVSWSATCENADSPSWYGTLNLVDQATGERFFIGGVASGSGDARKLVSRKETDRTVSAMLRISCSGDHGSEFIEPSSGPVVIPALAPDDGGGDRPGSGGGSGTGGGSGGAPPGLPAGACARELRGTADADRLVGTSAHERILGLGAADTLLGRAGHDCLVGGAGGDRLDGEAGSDALYGGTGPDTLIGRGGVNLYDAGRGNDLVLAANGRRETVRCGPGRDRARADRADRTIGCERVVRRRGR